jgi:hypothetical protein
VHEQRVPRPAGIPIHLERGRRDGGTDQLDWEFRVTRHPISPSWSACSFHCQPLEELPFVTELKLEEPASVEKP